MLPSQSEVVKNLVDTNLLLRGAQISHPMFAVTDSSIAKLRLREEIIHVCPQNCTEFWAVATRPSSANGLGFLTEQAEVELARIEALFPMLPDDPAIYQEWRRLVIQAGVSGKPTHDARLMAVAVVYGINNLLTFNTIGLTQLTIMASSVHTLLDERAQSFRR